MDFVKSGLGMIIVAVFTTIHSAGAAQDVKFVKSNGNVINALDKSETVGTIYYNIPYCYISLLDVEKQWQKRGIGSQLFKLVVEEMRDCEDITWKANLSSIDFYFKQGAHIDPNASVSFVAEEKTRTPYKNLTEKQKKEYLDHLYTLKKSDPTLARPYVPMSFNVKKTKIVKDSFIDEACSFWLPWNS